MIALTDTLVLDASVAVKWHLTDEDHVAEAQSLFSAFTQGQTKLAAPDHIYAEVASAITVATRGRAPRFTPEQGQDAIDEFLDLDIITLHTEDLLRPAYSLAQQVGCAFYDALYLAFAQELALPLITADWRLYQRIQPLPNTIWIGEYVPPVEPGAEPADPPLDDTLTD
ncbi:MAG: hypothetical protein CL878_15035 [Dehalococcoidia bacterium]|nr:hypothetical protein [Dehalococcoidia bacterium]